MATENSTVTESGKGRSPADIYAVDDNLNEPVTVHSIGAQEFPFSSGLTQVKVPAGNLSAGFVESMPAVLVTDAPSVTVSTLTLKNTAGTGSAPIEITLPEQTE